jgi:hypothetical protein
MYSTAYVIKFLKVSVLVLLLFAVLESCGETKEDNNTASAKDSSATSDLEGAWELVWSKTNDKINSPSQPMQLKLFTDGYFCYLMQDSTGKWSQAGGGVYETEGNTYKEIHRYNSNPEYVGFTDWQEYEIKGDTLHMKLFTKVINGNGIDVTANFPKTEEKRVRAHR